MATATALVGCGSLLGVDLGVPSSDDSGAGDGSGSGSDGGMETGSGSGSGSSSGAGDAGGDGRDDGSGEGGGDGGGCTPATQKCAGTGIVTCSASGRWGSAWACSTSGCSSGACTGQTTTGQSCQTNGPGLTTCSGATGNENCCTSLEVAGGTYDRKYANSGSGPTGEADPASVSGFRLDKYVVTVGRFRQYVSYVTGSGGAPPPSGSGKHVHLNGRQGLDGNEFGWDAASWNANIATGTSAVSTWNANLACDASLATWTNTAGTQENLPINCVDWYEAYAFCIWDGGFLPSEAEWEYAAAGGGQQREYPWGTAAPGTGNQYAIYGCYYNGTGSCAGATSIAPVGTPASGAGLWGQVGLAGNVFEWGLDYWDGSSAYANPCADCANLATASYRVLRGGSFDNDAAYLLAPYRYDLTPSFHNHDVGFRCARTP